MPYRALEDAPTSDVGFHAWGTSLDECFNAAAAATLAVMLDNPEGLQLRERRTVQIESDALDLLLLKFLEELIYYKDRDRLLLRPTQVVVGGAPGRWQVDATFEGEVVDPTRHRLSGDVKAVTLHRLSVQRTNGDWDATVVLDV